VAIVVLCVTATLCLGLWSNSAQETNRLKGGLWELENDYEKLALVRTSLEENYSELRTEKEVLETEYSTLENDYLDLEIEKDTLEMEYSTLNSHYSTLYSSHISLNEDYDELKSLFEAGEAIAESAEWITEDERLKVTSKLITSGTYWVTYTVSITITNIGDEPIDKVIIFIFPYKNGTFAETYWEYHEHTVENIYIGETYSHDFTGLPDEMTSYRVLAVKG